MRGAFLLAMVMAGFTACRVPRPAAALPDRAANLTIPAPPAATDAVPIGHGQTGALLWGSGSTLRLSPRLALGDECHELPGVAVETGAALGAFTVDVASGTVQVEAEGASVEAVAVAGAASLFVLRSRTLPLALGGAGQGGDGQGGDGQGGAGAAEDEERFDIEPVVTTGDVWVMAAGRRPRGGGAEVALAILPSHVPDAAEVARGRVREALRSGFDFLYLGHRVWWRAFWGASGVDLPDGEAEQRYVHAAYRHGCGPAVDTPESELDDRERLARLQAAFVAGWPDEVNPVRWQHTAWAALALFERWRYFPDGASLEAAWSACGQVVTTPSLLEGIERAPALRRALLRGLVDMAGARRDAEAGRRWRRELSALEADTGEAADEDLLDGVADGVGVPTVLSLREIQRMLVQPDDVGFRVFPSLPEGWASVNFTHLRVPGGHLVSAQRKDGVTTGLTIYPAGKGVLRFRTPFPEGLVVWNTAVSRGDGICEIEVRPAQKVTGTLITAF